MSKTIRAGKVLIHVKDSTWRPVSAEEVRMINSAIMALSGANSGDVQEAIKRLAQAESLISRVQSSIMRNPKG